MVVPRAPFLLNIQDAARYMPDHLADDNADTPWTIWGF